jgi:DNA-binding CsgD family transcriptional regulator
MSNAPRSRVFASGNAARLLDAIHRIDLGTADWLGEVCGALRPLVPWAAGLVGGTGISTVGRTGFEIRCVVGDADVVAQARRTSHNAREGSSELMKIGAGRVYTLSDSHAASWRTAVDALLDASERHDALMVTGVDIDGPRLEYVGFTALSVDRIALSDDDRDDWNAGAAHLAAAWRLRRRLSDGDAAAPCEAVLTPSGGCSHAEGVARDSEARDALSRAVRALERARTRERRTDDQALLEAWQALYEGRWTLVEEIDTDGRRSILARVNEARRASRAELSPREQEIAHLLSVGIAQKAIAYELGIPTSTVAYHVRNITTKLGARSTVDAVRMLSSQRPTAAGSTSDGTPT